MSMHRKSSNKRLMSSSTIELMLLLYDDGVDRNELKALVDSAFTDGMTYTLRDISDRDEN